MPRWPGLGYKKMDGKILHLYTECPEGKVIPIAKRDSVEMYDPDQMNGLDWCIWCKEKDRMDNPPIQMPDGIRLDDLPY